MSEIHGLVIGPLMNGLDPPYMYRVPIEIIGNEYRIYVGHSMVRTFDSKTLPDFIKVKLALISATDPSHASSYSIFTNAYGPDYKDVGWRTSEKDMYIIVMTLEQLRQLQGVKRDGGDL